MRDTTKIEYERFLADIAKKIKKARNKTVPLLTPEEMADKTKVTSKYIYMLEKGRRKPSLDMLFIIAAATGTKLDINFV